jgi:hypothetical protein
MFFGSLGVNEDVINEDHHKLVQVRSENAIHIIHENSRSICQSEWHHQVLIMVVPCPKYSLRSVFRLNPNLVVSRPKINLGKHLGFSQLVKKIVNSR